MKFLIAGAGAIGAYVGARMARAGQDVTLFARGPHLRAMQRHGVRVKSVQGDFVAHPKLSGDLREIGPADVVVLGVKAHSLAQLAPQLKPLLGPDTVVLSIQNGVPWWFFQGWEGPLKDLRLERLDPGGIIASAIEARRIVGACVYISSEIVEPGVIRHVAGDRITLGEPDGAATDRTRAIAQALVASGLRAPISTNIRQEIWVKLLGNTAFNPISALTGATLTQIVHDREACELARNIMREAEAVALKLGLEMPITIEKRIAGAEQVGEHKTSMLQDLEAGRPLEIEAVVGAVLELGERLGIPMPHTRSVYACTKLLAERRARKS
ncbi:MAG TPA: 2-dehydropantoate 2-reductase [Terriglobales bacterium]|nr:2-dehydropantoate 2-reductase [Terriglobales bacterium]